MTTVLSTLGSLYAELLGCGGDLHPRLDTLEMYFP